MPDHQLEPTAACSGCGSLVVVRFKDKHRTVCPGAQANTFRQYREQHGGTHAAIDETVKSFDQDIEEVFKRLNVIDDRHDAGSQAGITLTSDLDLPDLDDDLDETVPPARHPLTDVNAPRINPLTGLPE